MYNTFMKFNFYKSLLFLVFLLSCFIFSYVKANTVAGFVKDVRNGETLSYVNVIVKDTNYGAATDKNGYYVISGIPAGSHTLVFSMIGYKVMEKEITVESGQVLKTDAFLEPEPILMKELVVSAERERFT